eukprot:CAMPEP_0206139430 /NCGR_PEP_ID=MMETSP1473-20131121/6053_1 /ASSEMBLY_ACC=CAM_ASM_001109 /TAXON_ID=1461547 /ORGANISM="Stichococcus sp, Strain RCC1054" /LENGTH=291 /DNA_ID=CAMNT_0053533225 /DNA_START=138 /DNA_END=1013 /DNA_ORIENTATION=+
MVQHDSEQPRLLSDEQLAAFHDKGYLVLPDFATSEQVEAMKARALELIEQFEVDKPSIFSTVNQQSTTDNQFLDSASGISIFLEEKALGPDGKLQVPKSQAANKIGHALHDLDPAYREFSRSPKMAQLFRELNYRRPLPVQSMHICKQPNIGGEVVPHQDSAFLWTDPPTATGIWVALENATKENGCLFTLPGSQKGGVQRRFKRRADDTVFFEGPALDCDLKQFVPLECKAGALVVLHGANVHFSHENTSPQSRHAYSMHVVEGTPATTWAADNWLQRVPEFPFEPLYEP